MKIGQIASVALLMASTMANDNICVENLTQFYHSTIEVSTSKVIIKSSSDFKEVQSEIKMLKEREDNLDQWRAEVQRACPLSSDNMFFKLYEKNLKEYLTTQAKTIYSEDKKEILKAKESLDSKWAEVQKSKKMVSLQINLYGRLAREREVIDTSYRN